MSEDRSIQVAMAENARETLEKPAVEAAERVYTDLVQLHANHARALSSLDGRRAFCVALAKGGAIASLAVEIGRAVRQAANTSPVNAAGSLIDQAAAQFGKIEAAEKEFHAAMDEAAKADEYGLHD